MLHAAERQLDAAAGAVGVDEYLARDDALGKALQSGQVFVNDYGAGGGVELPFGGVKKSGHGREKGWAGLLSFTTLKTVAFKHT